ncbi:MAG: 1-acyl-sn-glycerol-3-phosphate acyltransferase [Prevotella sp.]|uniref:1-acyl-sn-glycerol-3-phosphate acyltransferase n=1 Tax=Prevotella sp. TaxID=59823 RepID=UPI002A2E0BE3|nr:1-acyl-sn-glycerol-3-phosphate acyltransferase [Prevotella sp.]MDD7317224.1 1-acyl-sn-glycerol-3-phosphate acyltransferase [Prevotellaceae bacterium]MDY4019828.1 1-acyl-sn-glycerol-3-phosphate acyltransferase [Prevotella sp.]
MTISDFDAIRPFGPEELPAAYDRLVADPQFRAVVAYLYPQIPFEMIEQKMRGCKTNLDFQMAFCYGFLENLTAKASLGIDIDTEAVDTNARYTFVSNHRDIVLDSALLDKLLVDAGFTTTCEVAIGDNLLSLPWVKDLVRINKSFIVERSLQPREMLMASKRMAEYMHYVISEKNDNVWIAQREGRAKDSNDRTQPSILKMMAMGGTGTHVERLQQLHIVPLAISYEFDPCDFLKAREFQLKRDNPDWKKGKSDDVESMKTGIMGFKGHIHYHCAPCIDEFLAQLPAETPKTDFFNIVAAHIDREIHRNYRIYPANYIAADMLDETSQKFFSAGKYSADERRQFEDYLQGQIAKIDIPGKDVDFLRERMLTMYANPLRNHIAASSQQ